MTRLVANMEWALEDRPGVRDIVEYESRLNYILPKYDDTVVCTYDLGKFSASAVMDILRTHPMVIVGDVMQENPFYTPPDVLLPELAARRQPPRGLAPVTAVRGMGAADASPEVGALRRCISDVVALSTLSAVWAGATRPKIAESLAQVLHETLGADLVYVGLRATGEARRLRRRVPEPRRRRDPRATRFARTSPPGCGSRRPAPTLPELSAGSTPPPGHADRHRCRARRDRDGRQPR